MQNYSKLDAPEINSFVFHPRRSESPESSENITNIDIKVDDGTTIGCSFYHANPDFHTILYFHGNGETVSDYDEIAKLYQDFGMNIFLASYRGYGWSTGDPKVSSLMSDSCKILDSFTETLDSMKITGPVFIMGRSLGSAAALELAKTHKDSFKGVIIESGFSDTGSLLAKLGVKLQNDEFDEAEGFGNLEKIEDIKTPTLILHGARDEIIPVVQAEKLQSHSGARIKKFFVIPGADHNSMIARGGKHYFLTIKSFMDEITERSDWRERRKKYKAGEK